MAKYNELGQEIPDPTPVSMPLGYEKPESLESMVQRMVRIHISKQADVEGFETFEEAEDFYAEDEDEELPHTQYQFNEMQEEYLVRPPKKEVLKDDGHKGSQSGDKESKAESGQHTKGGVGVTESSVGGAGAGGV